MMGNALPSQGVAIVGVIDPDANGTGTLTTGWIDMAALRGLMAVIMVGDLGTSATIDAKFEQATSSGGAGAKDVTAKAITQLTQAGTDSNKQAVINLRAEELDRNNGFRYARLSMATGTAASDSAAVVLGFNARYGPASDSNVATVDETIA